MQPEETALESKQSDAARKFKVLQRQIEELQKTVLDLTQLNTTLLSIVAGLRSQLAEIQIELVSADDDATLGQGVFELEQAERTLWQIDHKHAETVRQESERRYKQLVGSFTDYVYTVEVNQGQPTHTIHDPDCVKVTGYSSAEYEADPNLWSQMIYEADREMVMTQVTRLLAGQTVSPFEHRLVHKNGLIRWIKHTLVPHYNQRGHLVAFDGLISDTTERKQAELERERLLASEREQRILAETLGEVFLALTAQTSREDVLDEILAQLQRVVSYSGANIMLLENDLLCIVRWQGYESFGSEKLLTSLQQSLADFPLDAEVVQSQQPLIIADTNQNPQWVTVPELAWIRSFVAVPICLQNRVLGLLRLDSDTAGTFSQQDIKRLHPLANAAAIALENARLYDESRREIVERMRAEEALRESEANLRAIFDNTLQALLLIGPDYKFRAINKTTREGIKRVFGKEVKEGNFVSDVVIPEDLREFFSINFGKALEGETIAAEKDIAVGSEKIWCEFNFIPVFAEDGHIISICLSVTNIDTRKRVVDALAEREARLLAELQSALVINRALVSEIDLNNLLEFIITQAKHLTNADGVAVLLLSEDNQQLKVARPGASWSKIKAGSRLRVQGSLVELALASHQVQISNQVLEDPRAASISSFLQLAKVHSLLCAPLVAQHKQLGALLIWTECEQIFTKHDSRLISLFADQAALALFNAYLHDRNRQLAIEQERHRLARELHDSVTQSLYSIGLAAQASLRLLEQDNGRVRETIKYIHTLSQTALTEMREQLYHLHPTVLNKDLIEVLTQHCKVLSKQYSLIIEFKAALETPLSLSQCDTLYYIAREALWNIVKHARATHIEISLSKENNQIILSIKDDGVGFETATINAKRGMGLRIMKERAGLLGGNLKLESKFGQGTELMAWIPV